VAAAVATLQEVGALTPEEALTPLGHHLAGLPLDPRLGKLLLLGASLGCLGPAVTIAACMSHRSPFAAAFERQEVVARARAALAAPGSPGIAAGQQSDHLLMVSAYDSWRSAAAQSRSAGAAAARRHSLSAQALEQVAEVRAQFAGMLADIRFVRPPPGGGGGRAPGGEPAWLDDPRAPWNRLAGSAAVIKGALVGALSPNVAVLWSGSAAGDRALWLDEGAHRASASAAFRADGALCVHPSSVNGKLSGAQLRFPYLVFLEKVKTSRVFLRDCTAVPALALLLFGGELAVQHEAGVVLLGGWLRIGAPAATAVLVKRARAAVDALLQAKVEAPGADWAPEQLALVDAISGLLADAEKESP
jgi:ATP-dependent RNA helicase DHX29